MNRKTKIAAGAVLVTLAAGVPGAIATTGADERPADQRRALPFTKSKLLFELNATARDMGVQALLDAEGWETAQIYSPDGKLLLRVRADGSIGKIGVTELFFESAEPSLDDLPKAKLFKMFPEGRYAIVGRTPEGRMIVGAAELTHDIPAAAAVVKPREGALVDRRNTVIDWKPVTRPAGIDIVGYQVIVEREDPLRVLSVDVPRWVTRVVVPPQFLQYGTDYKLEVIAIERGDNQTITESEFRTRRR
ncbi:hypothetical protein [Nocardioides speluncae]|uniref:hypothetical protein n=1 Tax=Nocardioides speluncae TaxID=2670337 RepID=UPI000D68BCBA|nr:hypothetical protein [Nocardioides speluncae]